MVESRSKIHRQTAFCGFPAISVVWENTKTVYVRPRHRMTNAVVPLDKFQIKSIKNETYITAIMPINTDKET